MPRDHRQLPFLSRHYNKFVGAAIVSIPLFWFVTHPPTSDTDPISYTANSLKQMDTQTDRAGRAVKDFFTSGREIKSAPTAPQRTIGTEFPIDLCVPADLVDNQSWDHPESGSKMAAFRGALKAFILASGDPGVQYRVREGAFESFNPAANPASLVYGVDARAPCPPNDYRYTIPVVR